MQKYSLRWFSPTPGISHPRVDAAQQWETCRTGLNLHPLPLHVHWWWWWCWYPPSLTPSVCSSRPSSLLGLLILRLVRRGGSKDAGGGGGGEGCLPSLSPWGGDGWVRDIWRQEDAALSLVMRLLPHRWGRGFLLTSSCVSTCLILIHKNRRGGAVTCFSSHIQKLNTQWHVPTAFLWKHCMLYEFDVSGAHTATVYRLYIKDGGSSASSCIILHPWRHLPVTEATPPTIANFKPVSKSYVGAACHLRPYIWQK